MACVASLAKLSSDHAIDAGTAMGLGHFVTMFKNHVAGACSRNRQRWRQRLQSQRPRPGAAVMTMVARAAVVRGRSAGRAQTAH
jgi:hypothetical protein